MSHNGWHRNAVAEAGLVADAPGLVTLAGPPQVWAKDDLWAIVGHEPVDGVADHRWHISLRGPGRVPTWEELVDAAHHLRPGVVFVIGLPPRSWWINVHEDVLHLWEVHDEALVGLWRFESMGMTPT